MRDVRRYGEELLSARLREGVAQGDLSPDTEVEELAAFFEAALRGMVSDTIRPIGGSILYCVFSFLPAAVP